MRTLLWPAPTPPSPARHASLLRGTGGGPQGTRYPGSLRCYVRSPTVLCAVPLVPTRPRGVPRLHRGVPSGCTLRPLVCSPAVAVRDVSSPSSSCRPQSIAYLCFSLMVRVVPWPYVTRCPEAFFRFMRYQCHTVQGCLSHIIHALRYM